MQADDIKGRVDFAIIAIRPDEYAAVLQRFPREDDVIGRRTYTLSRVKLSDDEHYTVIAAKSIEQGGAHAQDLARDMIEDFDPQWILLVGIGGAVPADEYSLGDVVVATRLIDFSVSAALEGGKTEFAVGGGPMHKRVQDLLANLQARLPALAGWNDEQSIGANRPAVDLNSENFYGDETWKAKVQSSLNRHFGPGATRQKPEVTAGAIAASDTLIKDTKLIEGWRQYARQTLAVEMELAGVYVAARRDDKEYPILAIRGISDVIGFKRDADWTGYACHTAAAFACAFIKSRPIAPRPPGLSGSNLDSLNAWANYSSLANPFKTDEELQGRIDSLRAEIETEGSLVRVTGVPGAGKTRLVLEALRSSSLARHARSRKFSAPLTLSPSSISRVTSIISCTSFPWAIAIRRNT